MSREIFFVDVGNLYFCTSKKYPGRRLDYAKLLKSVDGAFRAIAYGTQKESELSGFITALKHIGYETKFKKLRNNRTSWNVGIAMDIVRLADSIDTIYLASSDPDLADALQWAKDKGIKCVVLSVGISRPLKDVAAESIELGEEFLEDKKCDEPVS